MSNTFINPKRNDDFVILRGIDLQDLLVEIGNYFLEYRDSLNLPNDDITFGTEIEYEKIFQKTVDTFIENNLKEWTSTDDGSVKSGGEVNSPVMTDNLKYWQELKLVCDYLQKRKADVFHTAGGHVHVGAHVLGHDVEAWRLFLKLYTAYEHLLFRFAYGESISGRKKITHYAPPIAHLLHENLFNINRAVDVADLLWFCPNDKFSALNFQHVSHLNTSTMFVGNTLEFRFPNASKCATIWQNNINTFIKMILVSSNKVLDEEFLDYKLEHEWYSYYGHEYMYDEIDLKNVLEFVDLVFDNNLDKIYFLRQYLKDFQDNYGIKKAIPAKKFVK